MTHDGVDESGEDNRVDQIGAEAAALGDSSRHNGCCCSSKDPLKEPINVVFRPNEEKERVACDVIADEARKVST